MSPRYQIFVSSTFRDLVDERQAVLEAILELGHFPAGMEIFPAADSNAWELIKTVIHDSDYYVLIVGGKYGSTGPDGISYTEMEFNYAVELNKPILAFLHGSPDRLIVEKAEVAAEPRSRLQDFRDKVSERRIYKCWNNKDNLKAAVLSSLAYAIRTKPADGWVRNEGLQNQELLKRLASLQDRYEKQSSELNQLKSTIGVNVELEKYRGLDTHYEVAVTTRRSSSNQLHKFEITLSEVFFASAEELLVPISEEYFNQILVYSMSPCLEFLAPTESKDKTKWTQLSVIFTKNSVRGILRQFMALGLVEPQSLPRQTGSDNATHTVYLRCWSLTSLGRSKYLERRALLIDDN
ncbi:DUF4062 domain-containing protein [Methylomonas sp. EFPC3]|uniref:DUF4062 domain-containing protein n=1 Tax=Methylomonas sp. EFPC3 TaxID=3021710 RepID=UPI0024166739|nr:DUF4062 domain-containing protein [Methylomonas sp. EFPC3]WFP49269.1 DUF4062 domain-containing protein [Methylomonas sp. EFPC3]